MTTETANSKSKPKSNKTSAGFTSLMSVLAIVISLVAGVLIYKFIFGDPGNFVDGDTNGEPLDGSLLATIYKGGVIVPILVAVNLIIIIFSVERFITLSMAAGRGKTNSFVNKIKSLLSSKDILSAKAECDKQRGSLANVVRAGLEKYDAMNAETSMTKEQKVESLKKE